MTGAVKKSIGDVLALLWVGISKLKKRYRTFLEFEILNTDAFALSLKWEMEVRSRGASQHYLGDRHRSLGSGRMPNPIRDGALKAML